MPNLPQQVPRPLSQYLGVTRETRRQILGRLSWQMLRQICRFFRIFWIFPNFRIFPNFSDFFRIFQFFQILLDFFIFPRRPPGYKQNMFHFPRNAISENQTWRTLACSFSFLALGWLASMPFIVLRFAAISFSNLSFFLRTFPS